MTKKKISRKTITRGSPKPPIQVQAHWLIKVVEALRRRAGWSQRELSRRTGMSGGWWVQIGGYGKLRGLETIEHALQQAGWELVARPIDLRLEPVIDLGITEVSKKTIGQLQNIQAPEEAKHDDPV